MCACIYIYIYIYICVRSLGRRGPVDGRHAPALRAQLPYDNNINHNNT